MVDHLISVQSQILSSRIDSNLSSDFSTNVTRQPVAFQECDPCEDCDVNSLSGSDREERLEPHVPKVPRGPKTGRPQPSRQISNGSTDSDVTPILRDELEWFEKVGAGATADVFRGHWRGRPVAIKQLSLPKQKSKMMKLEVAFSRETRVAAKVRHKNLVQFFGAVFEQQPYLMITELMSGGTVFRLLYSDGPRLNWKQRLRMCSDVANAMDYLHQFRPQIIHRDLKSMNVLLSETLNSSRDIPQVKVSDFGLAKMKEEHQDWDAMTAHVGTIRWMAPEVPTGRYNEKADVYSYAMVLYEIICYQVPFHDFETGQALSAIKCGCRPRLESVPSDCPVKLMSLMILCWTQDQSARPSFTQVRTALNSISFALLG